VREKGAMNCIISSEITDLDALKKELEKVPNMDGWSWPVLYLPPNHIRLEMKNRR